MKKAHAKNCIKFTEFYKLASQNLNLRLNIVNYSIQKLSASGIFENRLF